MKKDIIKKLFFPFKKNNKLEEKWWHRLFVVLYVLQIIVFLLITVISLFLIISNNQNLHNIKIKNDLRSFTKNNKTLEINTVDSFLNQKGKTGCLENNKIKYISSYVLKKESLCNSNINLNIDEFTNEFIKKFNIKEIDFEKMKNYISENSYNNEDDEQRYCFISDKVNCSSNKIINYNFNILFYLQIAIYSALLTYIFSILLQIIYFKGLVYIIYGKK